MPCINVADAKRQYRRILKLFNGGVASDHEKDRAETLYRASVKRFEQLRNKYRIFTDGYRTQDIDAAQAAVSLIRRKIQDATITSPLAGIVSENYAEQGELVSTGSLLLTVIHLTDCWIMAYVSEKISAG